MGYFNSIGGVASPLKQKLPQYWYKVNGKKVTYKEYKKAWKHGVENRRPNLQTNDPDPFGIKAKHKKEREKLRKPTVLTEEQTKVKKELEKRKNK
jgi:hypothetical protein